MKITCKTEYAEVTLEIAEHVDNYGAVIYSSKMEENTKKIFETIELCAAKCKEQSEAIYKLKTTF